MTLDGWTDGDFALLHIDFKELPEILPILTGEIIYNLRAALDYLVYELSILDSCDNVEEEMPQFIIVDTDRGWQRQKKRLQFLCPVHQAAIRQLQPIEGCAWTGKLRDLSNPDKHRTLSFVNFRAILEFSEPGQFQVSKHIAFSDGLLVEETLQELISNITNVLDCFKPDFQSHSVLEGTLPYLSVSKEKI